MDFKLCTNAPSLYLPDPDAATARFGYFLANTTVNPTLITLADSWNTYVGIYFFLGKEVEKAKFLELSQKIKSYCELHPIQHTACLWTMDYTKLEGEDPPPPDRYSFCAFETCYCKLNNSAVCPIVKETPMFVTTTNDAGVIKIELTSTLYIGTYNLPIIAGSLITINTEEEKLLITYGAVPGANAPATSRLTILLGGNNPGTVQSEACLHDFSPDLKTGWNVGLRYNTTGGINHVSQYYPVFDLEDGQQWLFQLNWDPLHPINTTTNQFSYLKFTDLSFKLLRSSENPTIFTIAPATCPNLIKTAWRTIYGDVIWLRPMTNALNAAKLVFQQFLDDDSGDLNYYLAPDGDFQLCVLGRGGEQFKLLCGLSGAECIEFTAGDEHAIGDILSFYQGNNAFTDSYPLENTQSGTQLLQAGATVPWILIKQGTATIPTYYAAPQSAGLYLGTNDTILSSFFAPAARFTTKVTVDGTYAFPMVPYAGISQSWPMDFAPSDLKPFEDQIIGNARRKILSAIPLDLQDIQAVAADQDDIISVTPQGLLATTNGLDWKSVVLATDSKGKQLSFTPTAGQAGIPQALRNAFQTNDLFLVISDSTNLGSFQNQLGIDDWQFDIKVPKQIEENPVYENIIILKFRTGTLLELVGNYNFWTDALSFNLGTQVNGVQTWLTQYCNDAIAMSATDTAFSAFASRIQDPNWFGIIAVNVDIDLGAFPNDLKGLVAAMDLGRFRSHHVGIEISFIEQASGTPSTSKTSLFGLVNYIDPEYAVETKTQDFDALWKWRSLAANAPTITDATYAYKVLKLQVLFAGSTVTNFISKLQFTARKWFGDAASLTKPATGEQKEAPNYTMLFNGHYENHDGHATYTFLTDKGMEYLYYVDSKVVKTIDFIKAQFSTFNPKAVATEAVEHIAGLFSFVGYLNFMKIDDVDLFSYGSEEDDSDSHKGLYFSNIAVNVNFDLDTQAYTTQNLELNFNPVQASFDASFSTTRKDSLVSCIPITPVSFMAATTNSPKTLGYVHIRPPLDLQSAALGTEWYGLNTDFHWGGPGALADDIGFVPNVLLAWSPGNEALKLDLSIRLPGSGGQENLLSLQSVLKLKIKNFNLVKVVNEQKQTSYNLLLNGITLNVLGLGFPPVGNTNLAILGNPNDSATMGWYGLFKNS